MNGISVVLPAYMEEENLKAILPKIREYLKEKDFEIIIVDTQQPMDNTKLVCEENGCRYLPRTGGEYYGDAIRTGIDGAKKEYTVIMDADGSHDPMDILRFYEEMESGKWDLIIGSRYCKGGNTCNTWILRAMSRVLNMVYKLAFRLSVEDVSDSFRMYKTSQLKKLELHCQNFDIVEEILILLTTYNKEFRIKEVPIVFNKRAAGKSKRNLLKYIFSYLTTMRTLLKRQSAAKKEISEKNNEK